MRFIAALCLLAATGTPLLAEDAALAPFGESITVSPPEGFTIIGERQDGAVTVWEAVPTGETATSWTQLYQVTAHEDWLSDPSSYVSMLSGEYFAQCKDTFGETAFGSQEVAGSEDSYGYWMACGTVGRDAGPVMESAIALAITAADHHYSVRWYERAAAVDEAPYHGDFDEVLEARLAHMVTTTRLCAGPGVCP